MIDRPQKKWRLKAQGEPNRIQKMKSIIGEKYGPLSEILIQKGFNTLNDILNWTPGVSINSIDPMQMVDMPIASNRLLLAKKKQRNYFHFWRL